MLAVLIFKTIQIDYHALGEKLGLTYTQAKTRYYSLRSRIQKLMESTPKVEDQGSHDPETESGLQTEPGESTPAEEENLTTMETNLGEQAEGELADAEDEAEDI